jgi:hypothetical protein
VELGKPNTAQGGPDQNDAEHESEIAQAIGEERLLARVGRGSLFVPKPNQQITGEPNQLPEDEHHDQVVRQHNAQHREHEET